MKTEIRYHHGDYGENRPFYVSTYYDEIDPCEINNVTKVITTSGKTIVWVLI